MIINQEQRLYVIKQDGGFSCIGFNVADRRLWAAREFAARELLKTAKRLAPMVCPAPVIGSVDHFTEYQTAMDAACYVSSITNGRCEIELTPQLIGLEGRRVEVIDQHGDKRRFNVGKSTGWMPCHLELHNSRSIGGESVYGAPFQSVRVIK